LKNLAATAACCAALLLAGCESDVGDSVSSVLSAREAPRSRDFTADTKAVYEAARAAADEMGYRFVHGGPAEGKLEALSGISGGDESGSSRQIKMRVRISATADSACEVTVSFSEIIESDSSNQPGMATETPMKDTPLYEVFFRNVQQALKAQAAGP
jgi:hypothetical protein